MAALFFRCWTWPLQVSYLNEHPLGEIAGKKTATEMRNIPARGVFASRASRTAFGNEEQ